MISQEKKLVLNQEAVRILTDGQTHSLSHQQGRGDTTIPKVCPTCAPPQHNAPE